MASTPVTEEQVIEALRPVEDPELHRSIVDLNMLRAVQIREDGVVGVLIALTVPGCPLKGEITRRVSDAATELDGVESIDLEFTVMTDQEREDLRKTLHGDAGSSAGANQAHGHAEGREIPFAKNSSKTRPLLISSGKGGVGKSSVTTNLAVALAEMCIAGRLGAWISDLPHEDLVTALFSESAGRLVVELEERSVAAFMRIMDDDAFHLGVVSESGLLELPEVEPMNVSDLADAFNSSATTIHARIDAASAPERSSDRARYASTPKAPASPRPSSTAPAASGW